MNKTVLDDSDIARKIAHIAMRVFPPQTEVAAAVEGGSVGVRVVASGDDAHRRNVYIRLAPELLAAYKRAEALQEVKYDEYIEADLAAKARMFQSLGGLADTENAEQWVIADGSVDLGP